MTNFHKQQSKMFSIITDTSEKILPEGTFMLAILRIKD